MSKRNRLRIIPSHLPLIRERVMRAERQLYVHDVPEERAPVWDRMLDICRRDIERKLEAPLYWVSRDMTRLAVDTAEADAADTPTGSSCAASGGSSHTARLRRRQWIPPFVKGPADKPLVCKDTVRIWRH